ncbi:hypothetical protein ACQKMD_16770 [Viridibacillus sp. NPDC096237]|uniref:hypothetical protein n=1 Tax=Viridibacillus sp. NPDC096237 TaxID=3390721 RepID=UPI003D014D1F
MTSRRDNTYTPVKRMIENSIRKRLLTGGLDTDTISKIKDDDTIEGVTLHYDENGRLAMVEGDERQLATLTFDNEGLLVSVQDEDMITGEVIDWNLYYTENRLVQVVPDIISEGDEEDDDFEEEVFNDTSGGEDIDEPDIDLNPISDNESEHDFSDDESEDI